MSYNHPIPDAPIALSMLPLVQAENLEDNNLMYLVVPNNPIGQRCKALALSVLADWLADNNMSVFTTTEINVGSAVFKVGSNGPIIETLFSLISGSIEATTEIKVGGSSWVPGNAQPSISGLYSLAAGNVDSANVMVDTLKAHSSGETKIAVEAMLVKSLEQANEKLSLGPTQMNGDSRVVGKLQVDGLVTSLLDCGGIAIDVTDSASVTAAEQAVSDMANGQVFILVNSSSSAQEFHFSGGAVVSIAAKHGLSGIKRGGYSYPLA